MKSLQKTLDILEYVVLQNGASVTPTRVAEFLGINSVTCTRIMGELVRRGYLMQISRKAGYIPGPMITSLGTRNNHYERLAAAARGPVARLSERLRKQVNLAVLNRSRRIMLCYHLSNPGQKPWDRFFFTDHWETATGRLLISSLDDRSARDLAREVGIHPFPKMELEKIRREGFVRFEQDRLVIIGHLIKVPGYPPAAFGFGIEPEGASKAFAASRETADEIRRLLEEPNRAY